MNRERLQHLITVLNRVSTQNLPFDLHSWGSFTDEEGCRIDSEDLDQVHACGTTACACGYAALDPEFQAQGFKMRLEHYYGEHDPVTIRTIDEFNRSVANLSEDTCEDEPHFDVHFEGSHGWPAITKFFDLTLAQAHELFSSDHYGHNPQPSNVIARIKELIA